LINWNLPDGEDKYSYEAILFNKPFIDMSRFSVMALTLQVKLTSIVAP
jgi:hypothetical protein